MHCGRLTSLLLLLLLLAAAPSHAADDDLLKARADARAELLEEATRAMRRQGGGAIEAMKRGLVADQAFVDTYEATSEAELAQLAALRATLTDRLLLLGEPARGQGDSKVPATDGALHDAVRLLHWLEGRLPCAVLVSDPDGGEEDTRSYDYPPPEKPKPAPASAEVPGNALVPATEEEPEPGSAKAQSDTEKPSPETPEKPTRVAPPTEAERMLTWAEAVRATEGQRFTAVQLTPARCTVIPSLLRSAESGPVYVHPDLGRLNRHALVTEHAFAYNLPQAVLRGLQADARNVAMQADRPQPALVDSSMVREKAAAVSVQKEGGERLQAMRLDVISTLDRMVEDLDGWKTQAALLAGEIGGLRASVRGDAASDGGGETAEQAAARAAQEAGNLGLRLAQARETLTTIEISLLYEAAVRAKLRLEVLERLLKAAERDTHAAEVRHQSYEAALLALRSTRRLDRLGRDRKALVRWRAPLREQTLVDGSVGALRLAAYDTLLAVNDLVREAVRRRGEMMAGAVEREAQPVEAPPSDSGEQQTGPRLSKLVTEPRRATWDVKYIEIARRELLDEELRESFDVSLVAEHFAEASERVNALVAADRAARGQDELAAQFGAARRTAEEALKPLASDIRIVQVRKLPAMLAAAAGDFEAALVGIVAQREHNRERLRALVSYQELLRSQGTRSLLIRIDRSQRDPYFGDVVSDTRVALESAGAWASFQGESHIGGFLARMWLRLLLLLALLIAVVFLAGFVRRQVDRWIAQTVAAHPDIRASVRDERAQAKRRRARADRAAHEMTEDEVLQQVALPDEDLEERAAATPDERVPPGGGAS